MCTNSADTEDLDDGSQLMISNPSPSIIFNRSGVCKKCEKYTDILYHLSAREAECRECFLKYVRHKFRATLGSSKILAKNAQVLLVFDGSAESIMLLDIMHHAITESQYKRLHCTAKVLYLDDALWYQNKEFDVQKVQAVNNFISSFGIFESYLATLNENSKLLKLGQITEDMCIENNEEISNLQNIKTLTSKQDYIYEKKKRIISNAGNELNCQYVFVPDTSATLATRLLTSIALGRGSSAAMDVELLDDRRKYLQDVLLIRPMKDVNMNEVKFYLHARDLHELNFLTRQYGHELGTHASLQNLTQTFIENLQTNFPATVSTVYRTGTKMTANKNLEDYAKSLSMDDEKTLLNKCDLCLANLDFHDSNTLIAIEFSRLASEAGNTVIDGNLMANNAEKNVFQKEETYSRLCHGCRNIYR